MIERYQTEEMAAIWNEQAKFNRWAKIEKAAAKVMYDRGEMSASTLERIIATAAPTPEEVLEREKITNHDVVAFIQSFTKDMGEDGRLVHKGLTSSDICDTANALAISESIDVLFTDITDFADVLLKRAKEFKYTVCMGRTHGVHAEPTTFGLRILGWYAELLRNMKRMNALLDDGGCVTAKFSGAVGNYTQNDPDFEKAVLENLSLKVEPVSTQVVPRDRYADLFSVLSLIGGMVERIALEIRHLQRTEVGEVHEGFRKGQTGSSAMPHKKNPILSERLCGLSRLLRGYMLTAHENMALWHDRDISHSSTERVILPDAFHTVSYMLQKCTKLINNLVVFPKIMISNINKTKGLCFSQRVLTYLVSNGISRSEAYEIVQKAAMDVWNNPDSSWKFSNYLYPLLKDRGISMFEVEKMTGEVWYGWKGSNGTDHTPPSIKPYLEYVDAIFARNR